MASCDYDIAKLISSIKAGTLRLRTETIMTVLEQNQKFLVKHLKGASQQARGLLFNVQGIKMPPFKSCAYILLKH